MTRRDGELPVNQSNFVRVILLDQLERRIETTAEWALKVRELHNSDGSFCVPSRVTSSSCNICSHWIQKGRYFEVAPKIIHQHVPVTPSAGINHVLAHLRQHLGFRTRDVCLVRFVELIDFFWRRRLH